MMMKESGELGKIYMVKRTLLREKRLREKPSGEKMSRYSDVFSVRDEISRDKWFHFINIISCQVDQV